MSLIKDITDIRKYIAIDNSFTIDAMRPDIKEAEEDYIITSLGRTTYDNLNSKYNADPPTLNSEEQLLLTHCQEALSNLAFARHLIVNRVSLSNSGIRVLEDGTYKQAFRYMFDELMESFETRGFNYIDKLLAFLEANKLVFTDWVADEAAFTINKKHFIREASEFDGIYRIGNSRRTFKALEPVMQNVEDFMIEYTMGIDQYRDLKDKILAGNELSDDDLALLDRIQPALAYLTIGHAIDELTFEVSENGLLIKEHINTGGTTYKKSAPTDSRTELKRKAALDTGNRYLDRLRDFLNANASESKYIPFFNSDKYQPLADPTIRTQSTTKTFVA